MADESITKLYGMPADEAFDVVCTAVSDLPEYSVKKVQTDALWGHWVCNTANPAFLEIQVTSNGDGSRIELELRNSDTRDRIGLLRREAKRVANRIQQRMESQVTGLAPPPAARIVSDRMVMAGALGITVMFGFLNVIYNQIMALF